MKSILATLAILLVIIGYIPYLKNTFSGKTKPHMFSWLSWSLISFISFGLQISHNGGIGSFVNFALGVVCFVIFIRALRNGRKDISLFDVVSLILNGIALILWLAVNQPMWSAIIIIFIGIFSFYPTFRKSWNKPYEETLFTWFLSCIRHVLVLYSLSELSFITASYPAFSLGINSLFCVMLVWRRKVFKLS